jgi:hypothetical protein
LHPALGDTGGFRNSVDGQTGRSALADDFLGGIEQFVTVN